MGPKSFSKAAIGLVSMYWKFLSLALIGFLLKGSSELVVGAGGGPLLQIFKSAYPELGTALMIAAFLAATLEYQAMKRREQEVKEDREEIKTEVLRAVYKRYISPSVFSEVENRLLKSNIIRRQYAVTYTLSHLAQQPKKTACKRYINCVAQTSFSVVNTTRYPITHIVKFYLELPLDRSLVKYIKMVSVIIDGKSISEEDLALHTKPTEAGDQLCFEYPQRIPPEGCINVTMKANLVKMSTDQEVWTSGSPSEGIDLTVNFPKGFDVNAKAHHSQSLVLKQYDPQMKRWSLEHGIFPHQGVSFWWHPHDGVQCPHRKPPLTQNSTMIKQRRAVRA